MRKTKKADYNTSRALAIVQKYAPNVQHVEDALKDLEIEVTKGDCSAKRKDHGECVIAQACKRGLKADAAIVSLSKVYLVHGDTATRYCVPSAISREITAFDRGAPFEPGRYRLKAPHEMQRLGKGYEREYGAKKKKRAPAHITENVRAILGS